MSKERELINEMDKIIMKKYKPIGYLDRKEVEEILIDNLIENKGTLNIAVKNIVTQICQLKPKNQVVIAEGEIDNIKWESPYNKLVFYFKGLPKMIGIKIIKNKKVKIILEKE